MRSNAPSFHTKANFISTFLCHAKLLRDFGPSIMSSIAIPEKVFLLPIGDRVILFSRSWVPAITAWRRYTLHKKDDASRLYRWHYKIFWYCTYQPQSSHASSIFSFLRLNIIFWHYQMHLICFTLSLLLFITLLAAILYIISSIYVFYKYYGMIFSRLMRSFLL